MRLQDTKNHRLFGKPLMKCKGSGQTVKGKNFAYVCHNEAADLVFQTERLHGITTLCIVITNMK